jgi:hypothetical protein
LATSPSPFAGIYVLLAMRDLTDDLVGYAQLTRNHHHSIEALAQVLSGLRGEKASGPKLD